MAIENNEINELKAEIERLKTHVGNLWDELARAARAARQYDELLNKHCELLDKDMRDAFDRIKYMELKFFPHLGDDIRNLHKIIGQGENKADNPLDHRKK